MSRSRRRGALHRPTCRLQSSGMMLEHDAQASLGLVGYGVVEVRMSSLLRCVIAPPAGSLKWSWWPFEPQLRAVPYRNSQPESH
jgi:hypothetical protein